MTTPQLYACLKYRDADAALAFLRALGFSERLVVRDDTNPAVVHHAQLQWRDTGGVMLGSAGAGADWMTPGSTTVNLVVAEDADVDAVLAAGMAAGGRVLSAPDAAPHGGRNAALADPEGNAWNLDSYPGV
ncbi:VOC family protein [Propioniciclava soli]|uniref:VOC family protein n=1 Tax=Propioniciclava soli TaxID=2775081 RepID=UPI001E3D04A6|nr:VOC family protein [Propioniciclava soli]